MSKKHLQPGEKVPLKLTATERKLILEDLMCLDRYSEQILQSTPSGKPVMMTLDDLDELGGYIAGAAQPATSKRKPKAKAAVAPLIQFKITLLGSEPEIWRRIQIQDCTLDKLHEHIQTAMGWTNSHLHEFEIKGERYGDPALWDGGFDDYDGIDSTTTMVSDILPQRSKRFAFKYVYDFGDSWEHEILFEGYPPNEKGKKYPICLKGERACPPEDVGGVWGFETFLEALADPNHEEHEMYAEWGASFDPEVFDPVKTTRQMKVGLSDWRH
jgi:hypothetical protein